MKRYLARLAARAQLRAVTTPRVVARDHDPFTAAAEDIAGPADLGPDSAAMSPPSPPPSTDFGAIAPQPHPAAATRSGSQVAPSSTSADARPFGSETSPALRSNPKAFKPSGEASVARMGERPERAEAEATDIPPVTTPLIRGGEGLTRTASASTPGTSGATDKDAASPLHPTSEADLLRLADGFMRSLQPASPHTTASDARSDQPSPLLPTSEPGRASRHSSAPMAAAEPAATVHIGSLRVEIVAPTAAPSMPAVLRTRTVIHQAGGQPGRGRPARSSFGLRQL